MTTLIRIELLILAWASLWAAALNYQNLPLALALVAVWLGSMAAFILWRRPSRGV